MQSTSPCTHQGFTGAITLRLTDLIQMVCLARSDLVIDVKSHKGKGSIHIGQGQIRHAQTDLLTGAEAFFEILQWDDGQFEILPSEANIIESVDKPWEHLLLEAMRLQDENSLGSSHDKEGLFEEPAPDILRELDEVFSVRSEHIPYSDEPQQEESLAPQASCPSIKVLVVEDSAFFSKRLKGMLELDHAVEVVGIARNGKEALEFLQSGVPIDLITLDINMPVMSGDTALKHIMIRFRTPVVIISAVQPQSMHKIFDFLQLGAVDFLAKPGLKNDLASYGENLRKLVKSVAKSQLSAFKRWRMPQDSDGMLVQPVNPAQQKLLIIVGAEGAHMEWLRLPLKELCSLGPVIGLQKLEDGLGQQFAKFIEDKISLKTEYLSAAHSIAPGIFYLANANREVEIKARADKSIDIEIIGSTALGWENGMELWLERMVDQTRGSSSVYFLSGAEQLPGSLLTKLLDWKVRQVLSHPQSVVCPQMIDSIQPYATHFPDLISSSNPASLPEVLYNNGSYQDSDR